MRKNFTKGDFKHVRLAIESLKNSEKQAIVFTHRESINPNTYLQSSKGLRHFLGKPVGLWYSLGTGWLDFVENDFRHPWRGYRTAMKLDLNKKEILCLKTQEEIKEFERKYLKKEIRFGLDLVEWEKVAKDFKGVEISNYKRCEKISAWYNTWDMASGCIWDTSAIKKAEVIFRRGMELTIMK